MFNGKIYINDLEFMTIENKYYRKVITTTETMQLVLMSITPEDYDIGSEIHPKTTQFIRIEKGEGKAVINDIEYELEDNSTVIIPPNTKHNIINTNKDIPLQLYTIYTPPQHNVNQQEVRKTNK